MGVNQDCCTGFSRCVAAGEVGEAAVIESFFQLLPAFIRYFAMGALSRGSVLLSHFLPLTSLMFGVAFLLVGSGLLTTLLAIRGGIEGFDAQTLGSLGSAFFAGYLSGSYVVPRTIRRIGHIRAFSLFTAAVACITLLHDLFIDPWFWAILRFATGAAMVGLYTIIESWLNSYALPAHRSRVFSLYMAVSLGSLALAQQFLGWQSPSGDALFAVAAAIICAAVMPVAATRLTQPVLEGVAALGLRNLYEKAPVAFVAALFSGLAQGAFWGMSVVWADRIGMDNASVAAFMSLSIIGGALLQWPIGLLTEHLDRGHVISVVALIAAFFAACLFFVSAEATWFGLTAGFIYGGFAFALYPMAVARMMDRLSPGEIFSGNGSLLFLYGIGAVFSPALVGWAMYWLGAWALPAWYILVECLLAYVAWNLARQTPADIGQQTRFVPMVRTAPTAMGMAEAEKPPS